MTQLLGQPDLLHVTANFQAKKGNRSSVKRLAL